MKKNWKKLILWSSLGSLAVGTAVAMTRKPRRRGAEALACRNIPADCAEAVIWTERYRAGEAETGDLVARDKYILQPTHFKLWSVLDLGAEGSRPAGIPIYHVSHFRLSESDPAQEKNEEETLIERFYATVAVKDAEGQGCAPNCLARGGILEFGKCYVGGTSNGVLSGETHTAPGPVLNYQLDYSPDRP
jgi:hypothetical protein